MKRLSRIACSLVTATILPLAACGSDDPAPGQARFAEASLAQKQRALMAGAGVDAVMGMLIASFLDLTPPGSTCPRVTRAGDTLTATHDCTNDDGERMSGRIVARNLPPIFGGGNDPTRPIEVTFEGYRIESAGAGVLALDGSLIVRPDGSQAASLTASLGGLEVTTEATWRPAAGERQTADAGSTIEVTGLGLAEIEGSWNMSDAPAGVLALHGADVLEADFGRMANGCVPLTVDGQAAGQLCDE